MARSIALPETTTRLRYVVACRGPHCRERGSLSLRKHLIELLRGEPSARLIGYACFGQCDFGPNVMFYPEGTWFGGLSGTQDATRVVRHLTGDEPMGAQPLELPELERAQHLGNIAELVDTIERDRARTRRWPGWWPFS
jgi:(2Fe-2S) ferredoxin